MVMMMPVECVCDACLHCPELELDVNTLVFNTGNGTETFYDNRISCAKYKRCKNLKNFIQRNLTPMNEDKGE